MSTKAIIIEDMPDMRASLRRMLEKSCPEVEIIGEADSVVTGAKLLKEAEPDLAFLDIELPDGTAFDLLDIMVDRPMQFIFITGSDEYAVRAFRYAAVDYLLKPVDPDDLVDAVERVAKALPIDGEQIDILRENKPGSSADPPRKIALHTMDKVHIIDVHDILYCAADGNYTRFIIEKSKPILIAKTLKEYDKLLSANAFVRVHQSYLINLQQVDVYMKTDGGYLVMKNGEKIPVSTRKKGGLLGALEGIARA